MPLTSEQKQVVLESENNNVLVMADAGTGKTHTLLEVIDNLQKKKSDKNIFVFNFNRANTNEWQGKIKKRGFDPDKVKADTFHSFALQFLPERIKQMQWGVSDGKLVNDFVKKNEKYKTAFYKNYQETLLLIDLIQLYDIESINGIDAIAHKHGLEDINEYKELAWDYIKKLKKKFYVINNPSLKISPYMGISLTNTLYYLLKHVETNEIPKYDYVIMDEAQDMNPLYFKIMTEKVVKEDGKMIFVGDPKQAINGFQGGYDMAFNFLQEYMQENQKSYKLLTLTESFRNPIEVLELSNTIFGSNTKSNITNGITGSRSFLDIGKDGKESAVLCFHNQYLYQLYSHLLVSGVNANFSSMEFTFKDIEKLILSLPFKDMSLLTSYISAVCDMIDPTRIATKKKKINTYKVSYAMYYKLKGQYPEQTKELTKLVKIFSYLKKGEKTKKKDYNLYNFLDLTFTTLYKIKGIGSVENAMEYIKDVFDQETNITLTTIHKAKGMEWDVVYHLKPELLAPNKKDKEMDVKTKQCLQYVVITRSAGEYYTIEDFIEESLDDSETGEIDETGEN